MGDSTPGHHCNWRRAESVLSSVELLSEATGASGGVLQSAAADCVFTMALQGGGALGSLQALDQECSFCSASLRTLGSDHALQNTTLGFLGVCDAAFSAVTEGRHSQSWSISDAGSSTALNANFVLRTCSPRELRQVQAT